MDNEIIICPRCDTDNPFESDICYVCGEPLHAQQPEKAGKKWLYGVLFIIIIGIGIYYYYNFITREPPTQAAPEKIQSESSTPSEEKVASLVQALPSEKLDKIQKQTASSQQPKPQKSTLPMGLVVIRDITEKPIAQITTPVLAGGWIALPKRLCLGGYRWILRLDSENELNIVEGIIGENDQIGLWRIQTDEPVKGPGLYPWSSDKALVWVSLKSDTSPKPVKISVLDKQQHFIKGTLTGNISEAGVLFDHDKVVGWTFGSLMDGAYLWTGADGNNLRAEIRVDDFYRATFANSREEEFLMALAMGEEYTHLERLAAFANGFRFDSKLARNDRPVYLRKEAVIAEMRTLIAQAVQEGFAEQVANIFDSQVLSQTADVSLINDVASATVEGYDFEEATELTEDIADRIQLQDSKEKILLIELRSSLYQNWIANLLENGDTQGGRHAFELGSQSLPDDLKIHLLGVRLALAENDWAAAEKLLSMKEYPSSLGDQVRSLQAQISDLKGQEGKIVIQFAPGNRNITVTAILNQTVKQKFLVDTGASTVTIPSSTAQRLGLSIDSRNPIRKVYTAGGIVSAPEVVLPSIFLEGWEVFDVKALILDIPNQSDLGLLGLNFLERFRMDLNTEKGVLLLEPR
jgi:clan AA aspartic protease (TIGR02281 family)